MRFLFFILVFVRTGVAEIDCSALERKTYALSDLKTCTSRLVALQKATIKLSDATQAEIDNFLKGKTFFKNIALYSYGNSFDHFIMKNISSENLYIQFNTNAIKRFIVTSSPEATIELNVELEKHEHLELVEIGKLSNVNNTSFNLINNPSLSNISISFGGHDSFCQLEHVYIHGNTLLPKEFLNAFNQSENTHEKWSIQPEGECSETDLERNLTLFLKCSYIYRTFAITNRISVENFNLSGLPIRKIYKGCYVIDNSRLPSVAFLVGTVNENEKLWSNCNNVIKDNEHVCDYMDVVDNYPNQSTPLETGNNCHKCQTKGLPQANFSMLEKCEQVVVGNLSFEKNVAPMIKNVALRRIDGCYTIENTDLTSASFLIGTRTNANCINSIKNNRYLCDYMDVHNSYHSKNPKLQIEGNCKGCQTYDRPQSDFQKLTHCEKHVGGNLIFAKHVSPMPRWITLERIHGCFKIIGTDLTTVRFLIGTRTRSDCVNEIKNNPKLCDVQRVLDNIPPGTYIDAQNNCDNICYSSMELGKKSCTEVYTDSAIPINFTRGLKRVHGAIKVTSLKTETVDPTIFKDIEYDEIVFRNNEFLCDEESVRKLVPEGKKVTFKHNCWKRCSYPQIIHNRQCHVFEGILDFRLFKDVELFESVIQKITGIEGQLKVIGTYVRRLQFKNLKYVKSTGKGPAIVIKDNKYLEKLDLTNLTNVTGKVEPRVFIQNNGKFKFRRSLAKKLANQTGMRIGKSLKIDLRELKNVEGKCQKDDQFFKSYNSSKGFLYYFLVVLLIVLSAITFIILYFICKLCIEVETDGGH